MNKIKYIVVMLCLLVVGNVCAQERHPAALGGAPEYLGYTQVYDFIDELADMRIISVSSVVKPYDRNQIAAWLVEAAAADSLLSVRQRKELRFYLNDFALECEGMYDGVVQWSNVGTVVNKELWGDAFSLESTVNSQQSTVNGERAYSPSVLGGVPEGRGGNNSQFSILNSLCLCFNRHSTMLTGILSARLIRYWVWTSR